MKRMPANAKIANRLFVAAAGLSASSPILFLLLITGIVLVQSIPALRWMGWHFLTGITWNMGSVYGAMTVKNGVTAPAGASYGALPFIVGTLASSAIALVIAIPISLGTAMILAYRVRGVVKSALSIVVELLAGVPSVVLGLWGVVVLAPWVSSALGPFLTHFGPAIPFLKGPVGTGMGLLTSGLVLALMVIPIITATTRDLLERVPLHYREGGVALGMTNWEVVRHICLPHIRDGMIGSIALGWGRAMGETMAVLMVSGSAVNMLPHNLYSPISTMAAVIADQLDSAMTDASHMAVHALSALALVLLMLTLLTNLAARLLVNRSRGSRRIDLGVRV
ncbi:phosphate ABC transporter permease subunit PstC [Alicyclobacillus sp.]|uniref:phosphate ABC transporter permease subunit PstC n=1 Tax=Alicyclobacillus sp. TaxID=61169 RepID=UPI0025BD209B|nr:phosphate ABC transporter permease subunit PstC [Alicyclobacillus sp.]MCL6515880.1 phosphate ABC transporter permease subunit PstC [Alicyclobacillus sp.]